MICPALISWRWWGTAYKLFSKNEHGPPATFLCTNLRFEVVWQGLTILLITSQFGYKDKLHLTPKKTHVGSMFQSLPFGSRANGACPKSLPAELPSRPPPPRCRWWRRRPAYHCLPLVSAYKFSFPPTHPGDRKHFFGRRKKTSEGKRQTNRRVDGVRRFVFFLFFCTLTGFLISPGMVRIGVGRFFLEGGLINAKDTIYQELQDFILVPLSR